MAWKLVPVMASKSRSARASGCLHHHMIMGVDREAKAGGPGRGGACWRGPVICLAVVLVMVDYLIRHSLQTDRARGLGMLC